MEQIEMRLKNQDLEVEFRIGEGKEEKQIELIFDILKHFSNSVDHELEAFKNMLEEGYQFNKNQPQSLHHPTSEYASPAKPDDKENGQDEMTKRFSVREMNGKKLYQTYYICPKCGDRGKRFLEKGDIFVYCHKCEKRMRVRDAVAGTHGKKQDEYGNFFIAGKYKRPEERDGWKQACNE